MAKKTKDFSGELDNIMQGMAQTQPTPQQKEGANQTEKAEAKRGRPRNPNAAQQQRATFIIDKELLQEAWTPHTKVTGSPWSDYQNRPNTWYGYGWFVEPKTDTSKEVIYHTGDNGGFKILAARYPEDKALVLIFANRADWDRYPLMQQIEEIFGF